MNSIGLRSYPSAINWQVYKKLHWLARMQQALEFLEECEVLSKCLSKIQEGDWDRVTAFKNWTLNDVLVHLHFWNEMADLSVFDQERFNQRIGAAVVGIKSGGLRSIENETIAVRGFELFDIWYKFSVDMSQRWRDLDPKLRVPWAGPDMSVRSSITARQMETWAHGQEVFDALGITRSESDRIKNIVILGINTFGWSHQVQGLTVPDNMPQLQLTSPSGETWTFGDKSAGHISGNAVEFAQVVTQTRNVLDTDLLIEGEVASKWMATAQCFAGPPETPPQPGKRCKAV